MNQQTVTVSCPKGCEGDCDNCLKGINDGFELADEEQRDMIVDDEIETPAKFRHIETMPLKPHYCTLLDEHERKLDRRPGSHRNQGRKPRTTDMRRSPRLAPIMAEQFARRMEDQTQLSWLTSLYYEEIVHGFYEELERYNDNFRFLQQMAA